MISQSCVKWELYCSELKKRVTWPLFFFFLELKHSNRSFDLFRTNAIIYVCVCVRMGCVCWPCPRLGTTGAVVAHLGIPGMRPHVYCRMRIACIFRARRPLTISGVFRARPRAPPTEGGAPARGLGGRWGGGRLRHRGGHVASTHTMANFLPNKRCARLPSNCTPWPWRDRSDADEPVPRLWLDLNWKDVIYGSGCVALK